MAYGVSLFKNDVARIDKGNDCEGDVDLDIIINDYNNDDDGSGLEYDFMLDGDDKSMLGKIAFDEDSGINMLGKIAFDEDSGMVYNDVVSLGKYAFHEKDMDYDMRYKKKVFHKTTYRFDMNDVLCDKYEEKEDDETYGDNDDEDESSDLDDDNKCEYHPWSLRVIAKH